MVSRKRLHQKKPDPPTVPELMMKGFVGILVLAGIVAVVFVTIKLLEEEDSAATTPTPGTPTPAPAPGPPGPPPPPPGPTPEQEENNDLALGLGVGAALLVAAIIAVIVITRSRKRQRLDSHRAGSSSQSDDLNEPLAPKPYEPPETTNRSGGKFERDRYGNDDTTSLNAEGQTRSEFAATE